MLEVYFIELSVISIARKLLCINNQCELLSILSQG